MEYGIRNIETGEIVKRDLLSKNIIEAMKKYDPKIYYMVTIDE